MQFLQVPVVFPYQVLNTLICVLDLLYAILRVESQLLLKEQQFPLTRRTIPVSVDQRLSNRLVVEELEESLLVVAPSVHQTDSLLLGLLASLLLDPGAAGLSRLSTRIQEGVLQVLSRQERKRMLKTILVDRF